MERQSVSSSNINSIGYDEETQILEIEFNHGGIYQYFGVSESEYNGIMNAGSIGTYFHDNIKDKYNYSKV
ncbi:MAG: KTSC domain-containing protein [Candidatus Absconditabacteria bacterium]|nr:KTSC domain-containing protein [Candidatus Absconditabacteria bacterium]MDD4714429.1 KTSC domain-containing protein [Candidatus Absconditabacteria bacterium]